jgi:hypothetical protein
MIVMTVFAHMELLKTLQKQNVQHVIGDARDAQIQQSTALNVLEQIDYKHLIPTIQIVHATVIMLKIKDGSMKKIKNLNVLLVLKNALAAIGMKTNHLLNVELTAVLNIRVSREKMLLNAIALKDSIPLLVLILQNVLLALQFV